MPFYLLLCHVASLLGIQMSVCNLSKPEINWVLIWLATFSLLIKLKGVGGKKEASMTNKSKPKSKGQNKISSQRRSIVQQEKHPLPLEASSISGMPKMLCKNLQQVRMGLEPESQGLMFGQRITVVYGAVNTYLSLQNIFSMGSSPN